MSSFNKILESFVGKNLPLKLIDKNSAFYTVESVGSDYVILTTSNPMHLKTRFCCKLSMIQSIELPNDYMVIII